MNLINHFLLDSFVGLVGLYAECMIEILVKMLPSRRPGQLLPSIQLSLTVGKPILLNYKKKERVSVNEQTTEDDANRNS